MKNKSSAFSLIELSIVILIIGVLIAGVTQASRLVRQSKITTARTLTQSSPVNSIRGLLVWLEPTQESSFKSSESADGTQITTWYDSNPQLTIPNTFTASSSNITYKATGATNALPAVSFTGDAGFTGAYLDSPFSAYTIFYVVRPTSLASSAGNTIFYNGTSGTNGFGSRLVTTTGVTQMFYGVSSTVTSGTAAAAANQGAADIWCVTIAPNSVLGASVANPAVLSYRNGVADITTGTTTTSSWVLPTTNMFIGNISASNATNDFIGEFSEIIVFDSVLKKSDRQEIEKYLSKKYAITITQN